MTTLELVGWCYLVGLLVAMFTTRVLLDPSLAGQERNPDLRFQLSLRASSGAFAPAAMRQDHVGTAVRAGRLAQLLRSRRPLKVGMNDGNELFKKWRTLFLIPTKSHHFATCHLRSRECNSAYIPLFAVKSPSDKELLPTNQPKRGGLDTAISCTMLLA